MVCKKNPPFKFVSPEQIYNGFSFPCFPSFPMCDTISEWLERCTPRFGKCRGFDFYNHSKFNDSVLECQVTLAKLL